MRTVNRDPEKTDLPEVHREVFRPTSNHRKYAVPLNSYWLFHGC